MDDYDEDIAMLNAYFLILGDLTIDDLIDREEEDIYFPFNPFDYDKDNIQEVIDYYAGIEDYEKCIELRNKQLTLK